MTRMKEHRLDSPDASRALPAEVRPNSANTIFPKLIVYIFDVVFSYIYRRNLSFNCANGKRTGPSDDGTNCVECDPGHFSTFGVCQLCANPNVVLGSGTFCKSCYLT